MQTRGQSGRFYQMTAFDFIALPQKDVIKIELADCITEAAAVFHMNR